MVAQHFALASAEDPVVADGFDLLAALAVHGGIARFHEDLGRGFPLANKSFQPEVFCARGGEMGRLLGLHGGQTKNHDDRSEEKRFHDGGVGSCLIYFTADSWRRRLGWEGKDMR
jgi:hypothetical protein